MIPIPSHYVNLIRKVLEWHTITYTGASFLESEDIETFDEYECHTRLERILDRLYTEHRVSEPTAKPFEIEEFELYFLRHALSDAADEWHDISIENIRKEDLLGFLEWLRKR